MYRTIDAAFWTDPKVRNLNANAKLVFLYLITNPHTHVSGIYYLSREYARIDLGLSFDTLSKILDTLSSLDICAFDSERSIVWVKKMMHFQGTGEKNARSAAYHLIEDIHGSPLVNDFLAAYPEVFKHYKSRPKHNRKPLPATLRADVLARDHYRCVLCGNGPAIAILEIDHIVPVSAGGANDFTNLQTLCQPCNVAKADRVFTSETSMPLLIPDSRSLIPDPLILIPDKEPKIAYGEFRSVLLTTKEFDKLENRLNGRLLPLIEDLDLYSRNHPRKFKTYQDHYAVILQWAKRRENESRTHETKDEQRIRRSKEIREKFNREPDSGS